MVWWDFSDALAHVTNVQRFKKTMQAIQGAIMFSSMLPIGLGISGLWRIIMR